MAKLTDRIVKQLPTPTLGNVITRDSVVTGFGIRITAAGARSFVLSYRRKADGRQRRFTIGSASHWTTTAAREEARRLKRTIDGGADPVGSLVDGRAAPTVADLCNRFATEYLPRKRRSTRYGYQRQIAADIVPAIGRLKVAAVSLADVDALHRKVGTRAPTHANRVLALLSRLFSLAIKWGMRADNPCKGVERNSEHRRERYLTAAELTRLAEALDKLHDQSAANAVRLLLLTGARRGELLAARWADINLVAGVWVKPGATTKQGTLHRVPLSTAVCQLLAGMQARAATEWLFPAPRGGHLIRIDRPWDALRKTADIPDVHLHDVRHTYASVLASSGLSLLIIGRLLGHVTAQTTLRYSHLLDDPLRAATEHASAILTGTPSAKVVPIK